MSLELDETRRRQIEDVVAGAEGQAVWTPWRVKDATTEEVFERFYRELMLWARIDPATALRISVAVRTHGARALGGLQRARLWRLHGHVLRANALLPDASRHYQRAFVLFERQRASVEAGRTAIGWIDVLSLQGKHEEALRLARSARRRLIRADAATRARLESNIGTLHHHLGQYRLAVAAYRGARVVLRRAGHSTDLALVDFNLGQSLLRLGRAREAHRCFVRSVGEFERRGFEAQTLRAKFGLACATLHLGDWDAALRQIGEVRDRLAALGDEQAEAAIRCELSRVFGAFGDVESAEREARMARVMYVRLGIVRDAAQLALLHARWLLARGDLADAQVQLEAARKHFSAMRDRDVVQRIDVERAAVLLETGNFDAARSLLSSTRVRSSGGDVETWVRGALLRAELELVDRRPARALRRVQLALDRARTFPEKLLRPALVLAGARALAGLGRGPEAVRWAKRAAREIDRLATRTGEDLLRRPLWSMRDRTVREAVAVVLEHGGRRAAQDALDLLSRAHSRDLVEDLLQQMPQLAPELRARIARLRDQLLHRDPGRPGDVRSRVLSREIDHVDRALRRRLQDDVDVVRRASEQASLANWRRRIPSGSATVVFDRAGTSSSAFVVDATGIRRVPLPDAEIALDRSWRPLQLLLEAASSMPTARRADFLVCTREEALRALDDLGRAFWEPLGLAVDRVHIVLPASLHTLPMEAIGQLAATVAGTVISRWPHPALIRSDGPRPRGPAVLVHDGSVGTRAEVIAVARVLRSAGIEVGVDSGRATLRATPRVCAFHVAGHGSVAQGHWVGTGIQLEDGWMGLEEVAGERRFRDALLYFASCGSAQRSSRAQGRFDGWATAGLSSGARSIVAALWKIDDRAAQEFGEVFYQQWAAVPDAARAAAEARGRLHAAGAHPYQWAPFSVVG